MKEIYVCLTQSPLQQVKISGGVGQKILSSKCQPLFQWYFSFLLLKALYSKGEWIQRIQ